VYYSCTRKSRSATNILKTSLAKNTSEVISTFRNCGTLETTEVVSYKINYGATGCDWWAGPVFKDTVINY